jgi:hypothetical protein
MIFFFLLKNLKKKTVTLELAIFYGDPILKWVGDNNN